ncbi:MAG: hypothetical protein EBQ95_00840 [Gammaproteobacteria bacterium]|nr:hypothetical protein [Gammaproteobacteria bacterium]
MPINKTNETVITIPYFNDEDILKELVKFLKRLLLKKGEVYVERLGDLPKDEIYKLHLTQKISPSKDFKRQAERSVHDYFILKENYLKDELTKGKGRKKSDEFVMQMNPEVMPQQTNVNALQNNFNQNLVPQAVIRQTPQRVRRGTAAVARQQSSNTLSEQIAQITMVSRQLQQLRLANQMQPQMNRTPSNRQSRLQKQEMEQQEPHRLVPRQTLNVFYKLMVEQELARKKKEEQELANNKKLSMQQSMRPKPTK